jgi:CO/xanthine dehydrogenase Mo-binding subunit
MPSPVPGTTVRHGVRHTLPVAKVRHVGEVVAAVVAESRALAEDARDLVEVDYETLPVVATAAAALAPGARWSTTSWATTSRPTSSSVSGSPSGRSPRPTTRSARPSA